jgi:hypothetical protein
MRVSLFEIGLGVLLAIVGTLFLRFRREIGDGLTGTHPTALGEQPTRRRNTTYNPLLAGVLFIAAGLFCGIWGVVALVTSH